MFRLVVAESFPCLFLFFFFFFHVVLTPVHYPGKKKGVKKFLRRQEGSCIVGLGGYVGCVDQPISLLGDNGGGQLKEKMWPSRQGREMFTANWQQRRRSRKESLFGSSIGLSLTIMKICSDREARWQRRKRFRDQIIFVVVHRTQIS